ncbi:MAG TPA: hypothetical protein VHJ20_24925 [Polyangia bacterium]|nr:hypothetical protein [Polyangia bacterium]
MLKTVKTALKDAIPADDDSIVMSEVEALLSVDAGRVPPGVVVFRARDPEAEVRRVRRVLAVSAGIVTIALAITGAAREPVAMLVLTTAMLALSATRTAGDPDEERSKKPTVVLTPSGMIVRDANGLRSWQFEDIADVRACVCQGRVGMLVVQRDGSLHFLDNLLFARGEQLSSLVRRHLQPRGV